MSFLDNLENNLKALESQEERDPEKVKRDHERRDAERNEALLRAPYVDALKNSAFTTKLLTECRTVGHGLRVLVKFVWIGETLRLDAKNKRMELIPTALGINAVSSIDGGETSRSIVNMEKDDPAALARDWLTGV
jgi:hypothetical protein